jgi:hypothetical protein
MGPRPHTLRRRMDSIRMQLKPPKRKRKPPASFLLPNKIETAAGRTVCPPPPTITLTQQKRMASCDCDSQPEYLQGACGVKGCMYFDFSHQPPCLCPPAEPLSCNRTGARVCRYGPVTNPATAYNQYSQHCPLPSAPPPLHTPTPPPSTPSTPPAPKKAQLTPVEEYPFEEEEDIIPLPPNFTLRLPQHVLDRHPILNRMTAVAIMLSTA